VIAILLDDDTLQGVTLCNGVRVIALENLEIAASVNGATEFSVLVK